MGRKKGSSAQPFSAESARPSGAPLSREAALRKALLILAPQIPKFERDEALSHACHAPGLRKASPEAAAWLSLVALARHIHSSYDALLDGGYDYDAARFFSREAINETLRAWGCRRQVSASDPQDSAGDFTES